MNVETAIKKFGGVRPLARRLGLTDMAVYQWRHRGAIPRAWQVALRQIMKAGK